MVYCSIDIIKIGYFSFAKEQNNVSVNFKYDEVKAKPDVYFLLFDGYPGQKSLMDSFNFDNKSMYDFLEKESFVNLKISANYDYTLFSMSSLFNMRYVPLGYTLPEPIQRDFQKRQAEIKEAQVFTIFEKMGYKIINNSIFDIKNSAGISEKNSFILGHKLLLTDKILFNRIDRDIGVGILDNIAKRIPFLIDHSFFSRRENNANVENKMSKTLSEKETPVFCYAHFLLPHEPYFYDSLGKEISKDTIEIQSWRYKPAFISYLKYSNTVIKKMINSIREKKPNAIIILMSDHGFRSFNSEAMYQEARFNNICSVYFPNKNYSTVSERITNINFFPFFFNAQFNQHLPYLKDTLIPMLH